MTSSSLTVCYAVKGGSGTTVTAAALALADPGDTLLVDLAGETPAALGIPEPSGDGIAEWLTASIDAAALELLTVEVDRATRLLPHGHHPCDGDHERWSKLAAWLTARPARVVVDAGTGQPPPPVADAADQTLLVTRPCYLALRRAVSTPHRPTGIVLIREPGRALHAADVERAVGVPVVAELDLDPAVARAVDAGLLAARVPVSLQRRLAPSRHSPSNPAAAPEAISGAGTTAAGQVPSIASIQTGHGGPRPVTVEVHVADGLSGHQIVGAGDQLCRTSRDRIRAAFVNSGLAWPDAQITVNVMPAGHGPPDVAIDVAIAAGILAATGRLDRTTSSNQAYVGQLGLDGRIIAVDDLDSSTVERVTGLPAANFGHLRDLASVSNPGVTQPVTPEPSPAGPILANWHQTPAAGVDPSTGLGGIG